MECRESKDGKRLKKCGWSVCPQKNQANQLKDLSQRKALSLLLKADRETGG